MSILQIGLCASLDEVNLDRLKTKNIYKTTDFVSKDPEEISHSTGVPYKDAVAIRKFILAQKSALPVKGNIFYKNAVESTTIISTGLNSVDKLLDGGLYTGEVTEICGGIAAGKTQLCLNVSASVIKQDCQTAVFIDTGTSFSARRLAQMLPSTSKLEETLARIHLYTAYDIYDVFNILESVRVHLKTPSDKDFYSRLRLLVLDNVASVVYPFLGGGAFAENQGLLCSLGHMLKSLAVDFSIAVLITNNTVGGERGMPAASLGRFWSSVHHVRLLLGDKDGTEAERTVTVLKNCRGETRCSMDVCILTDGPLQ
ncbi:hypothetical protein DPMN_007246 [Dreissena polymorpha]|uniref:RecA family profile 1 domain-containing protein n=2 Tax=Dreissena polymorpha TaxID=45954 RepID=A0A9D4RYJ6_DREPO|nr:hypothetical protein DPMN_007246 [Dreissena polymorpha]